MLASYGYDIYGIRSSKTENGVVTNYVVDHNRPYAQVLAESENGATAKQYTYGDDLLSQQAANDSHFYLYDGLGSTRALTDSGGSVTDRYDYEAFGELLNRVGETDNSYLYTGEQYDPNMGQYYLRARYYNQAVGRFTQMDTWMGANNDPVTLHKYLYANADPVNGTDPTGNFTLASIGAAQNVASVLMDMQIQAGFSLLDGALSMTPGGEETRGQVQNAQLLLGVASLGAGGFQIMKMLSKKFRKACNSFDGDTLVHTSNGLKKIKHIKIGEKVWAYDEEIGEKTLQEVIHLIQSEGEKRIIGVTLESGEVIRATDGHPFYVVGEEGNWIEAGLLKTGMNTLGRDGRLIPVTDVLKLNRHSKVYNLTVDNDHTYFVGETGLLVHNAGGGCSPISDINMRHIMSGDKFGGGHSVHGRSVKILGQVSKRLKNGVYKARVKNPVDGVEEVKTFFPDSWDARKIKNMIHMAHLKYTSKGGKGSDYTQWVSDGGELVNIRVVTKRNGGDLEVLTAHPVYLEH